MFVINREIISRSYFGPASKFDLIQVAKPMQGAYLVKYSSKYPPTPVLMFESMKHTERSSVATDGTPR